MGPIELLVEVFWPTPKDRIYVPRYSSSRRRGSTETMGLATYWKQFLPEDHILLGNKHINFWRWGRSVCGPCSEIHFDLRDDTEQAKLDGRELVNAGHHLVIEIWNLVFMQFNRKANGQLEPCRTACRYRNGLWASHQPAVLQGKAGNCDTDHLFQPRSSVWRRWPVKHIR